MPIPCFLGLLYEVHDRWRNMVPAKDGGRVLYAIPHNTLHRRTTYTSPVYRHPAPKELVAVAGQLQAQPPTIERRFQVYLT